MSVGVIIQLDALVMTQVIGEYMTAAFKWRLAAIITIHGNNSLSPLFVQTTCCRECTWLTKMWQNATFISSERGFMWRK